MPISAQGRTIGRSTARTAYRNTFIRRSHEILKMGYDRLNAQTLSSSSEESITGELTQAMQLALQDRKAARWCKHFWVHEETPVHDVSRRGKSRCRIDIEFMQHKAGTRPRFRMEAKRLRDSSSRLDYLGHEGLGRYLTGRYAKDDRVAGMLGYVQDESVRTHGGELSAALTRDRVKYAVSANGDWRDEVIVAGLSTYQTTHTRVGALGDITLLHSLLDFLPRVVD